MIGELLSGIQQREREAQTCSESLTKSHKSSSRLYGGAKRLLGQTAAAINLNSHVETRRLAFHTRWDMAHSLSLAFTSWVLFRDLMLQNTSAENTQERNTHLVSLFFSRPHLRTLLPGDIDENALFPLDGSIGSSKFPALNQLMMIWVIVLSTLLMYVGI